MHRRTATMTRPAALEGAVLSGAGNAPPFTGVSNEPRVVGAFPIFSLQSAMLVDCSYLSMQFTRQLNNLCVVDQSYRMPHNIVKSCAGCIQTCTPASWRREGELKSMPLSVETCITMNEKSDVKN